MHPASLENMERCVRWYLEDSGKGLRIADLGSQSVNGSYRTLFHQDVDYTGFDLEPGPGVDVVLESPYRLPAEDASFDLVVSGQMLEHCPQFWQVFSEVQRVLRVGGLAFLIAPSAGPIHRYPVDCYRFYPDAWKAMSDWANLDLVHVWLDERGPWNDLVGVFAKARKVDKLTTPPVSSNVTEATPQVPSSNCTSDNVARQCQELIRDTAVFQRARLCVEIGTSGLDELGRVAEKRWIVIEPRLRRPLIADDDTFYCDADDFFFFLPPQVVTEKIDLAVINGERSVRRLLRDFMNLERLMTPKGVIFVTDIHTARNVEGQSQQDPRSGIGALLASERPELTLEWQEAVPLLTISGVRPGSRRLWRRYNPLVRRLLEQ
jgi:hypothetical protein